MTFTASFSVQRGKRELKDVTVGAGSAEAQHDTMTLNVDIDKMSKGTALILLEAIRQKIHASKWPPA